MRLRAMRFKRKSYNDNKRLRVRFFARKLRLLTLEELCQISDGHGHTRRATPRRGNVDWGRPVRDPHAGK